MHEHCQRTLMGLTSPFLIANQGSKGGGGPFSSFGGLGCNDTKGSRVTTYDKPCPPSAAAVMP